MPTNFKNLCLTAILVCLVISSQIFASAEFDFQASEYQSGDSVKIICAEQAFVSPTGGGSDCWGWVDGNGTEYAIYAGINTIEFYNLDSGGYVGSIPAPSSTWHDIKSYQHYCYAVSEGVGTNSGLLIIDMQYLPDSVHYVDNVAIHNVGGDDRTSHNINIDTVQGYAYVEGTSGANFSVHILSLANPESPLYINSFGPSGGLHDMFCHNDTLYLAEGWNPSISIWNMANKNAPQLLTRWTIPNAGYVHNVWPTGDKRHVLTSEETNSKTLKLWNIENLSNVQLMDEYLAPSGLAHNAHIVGDTAYVSHYESGVVVLDLSDPNNIVELAQFDTYPASELGNFNGCWGVYPHSPSERFYASNMEGQLYILKEYDVVLADTLIALDTQSQPNSSVRVDLWANFSLPMHEFEIPFNWAGPLNLTYDSASTAGLMTEYFEVQQATSVDAWNKRVAYLIRSSNNGTSPDLPAGEGVILSLFFTIPNGASGGPNPITFTPFNGKEPAFRNSCINYTPDTLSGNISLGSPPCCIGVRGNIDVSFELPPSNNGVDISDLVFLVDFMFTNGPDPTCFEEADITADLLIDISDLVALVDFMFTSGPDPLSCP